MKYIRINEDDTIGFFNDEINNIQDGDIAITDDCYNELIGLQENGISLTYNIVSITLSRMKKTVVD